jgi:hypothetical protein
LGRFSKLPPIPSWQARRRNERGFDANDHSEKLAYIYFTERWADVPAWRDPLRDHYVIVFFSAEDKMTRMLSTVPDLPAIFPRSSEVWERLMWGEPAEHK